MNVSWHNTAITDRGLAFGDGCFETVRLHNGRAPFWPQHKARLLHGLAALQITADEALLDQLLQQALKQCNGQGIFKLIVTRGTGGRGYSSHSALSAGYYPRVFPLTLPSKQAYTNGLQVGLCSLRLAEQPALAGFKHLNRLEQVLARREVDEQGWDEGLLCDKAGNPVELTAMNVFFRFSDTWWTPPLSTCGVAGVARGWLLKQLNSVQLGEKPPNDLALASEAFACNSVAGILPVSRLQQTDLPVGKLTQAFQQRWEALWHD